MDVFVVRASRPHVLILIRTTVDGRIAAFKLVETAAVGSARDAGVSTTELGLQ
jgi:hypothetical protein